MPSALIFGSPNADKKALVVHGLGACCFGKSLSEAGYFVICPDMPNHGLAGTVQDDCSVKAFAETLNETYVAMGPFDLIVGHSLAGPVVAYLLPLLEPFHTKKVVLVDPALSVVLTDGLKDSLRGERTKRALDYQAENPKWTAMDSIAKEIGGRCMADETFLRVFDHNPEWPSYIELFAKEGYGDCKMVILAAETDAAFTAKDAQRLKDHAWITCKLLPGTAHGIQREDPDAIVHVALQDSFPAYFQDM